MGNETHSHLKVFHATGTTYSQGDLHCSSGDAFSGCGRYGPNLNLMSVEVIQHLNGVSNWNHSTENIILYAVLVPEHGHARVEERKCGSTLIAHPVAMMRSHYDRTNRYRIPPRDLQLDDITMSASFEHQQADLPVLLTSLSPVYMFYNQLLEGVSPLGQSATRLSPDPVQAEGRRPR